jgi:hypothetical protein
LAEKRLQIRKIREILRLKHAADLIEEGTGRVKSSPGIDSGGDGR